MPPIMEISVVPTGKAGASLGNAVAEAVKVAQARGVKYELTAMGTVVEGDLDTLFDVAREMHEVCFRLGYPRVFTVIKLDERRDKDLTMEYKVASVKARIAPSSETA